MFLAKLVPLKDFKVCLQDTVTLVDTRGEILAIELDPSISKDLDTFNHSKAVLETLEGDWLAYFVNVGRLETGSPIDRLAFTELIAQLDGLWVEPSPRYVWWVQVTPQGIIVPLEASPEVREWLTAPEHQAPLVSIYDRLSSTSKLGTN